MKITQTIKLSDKERITIQEFLGLCDEISDVAHCSMKDVFDYLSDEAEIIDEYKYSIKDTLQIAEIG